MAALWVENFCKRSPQTWQLFRAIFRNLKVMEWKKIMDCESIGPKKSELTRIFSPMFPHLKDVSWPKQKKAWQMYWFQNYDHRISFTAQKAPEVVELSRDGIVRGYIWSGE